MWEGVTEGEMMVMRQGGWTTGSGLTFYNITEDDFDWRSGDNPNGKSSCKRRRSLLRKSPSPSCEAAGSSAMHRRILYRSSAAIVLV